MPVMRLPLPAVLSCVRPRHHVLHLSRQRSRSWTACGRGHSTRTSSRGSCCQNGSVVAHGPSMLSWRHRLSCYETHSLSTPTYCALHEPWLHIFIRFVGVKHCLHLYWLLAITFILCRDVWNRFFYLGPFFEKKTQIRFGMSLVWFEKRGSFWIL